MGQFLCKEKFGEVASCVNDETYNGIQHRNPTVCRDFIIRVSHELPQDFVKQVFHNHFRCNQQLLQPSQHVTLLYEVCKYMFASLDCAPIYMSHYRIQVVNDDDDNDEAYIQPRESEQPCTTAIIDARDMLRLNASDLGDCSSIINRNDHHLIANEEHHAQQCQQWFDDKRETYFHRLFARPLTVLSKLMIGDVLRTYFGDDDTTAIPCRVILSSAYGSKGVVIEVGLRTTKSSHQDIWRQVFIPLTNLNDDDEKFRCVAYRGVYNEDLLSLDHIYACVNNTCKCDKQHMKHCTPTIGSTIVDRFQFGASQLVHTKQICHHQN